MKGVIISAILAVVMVTGSLIYTNHIDSVSLELRDMNEKITEELTNNRFDNAGERTRELQEYIEKHRATLAAMGNHEDFDKIEMSMAELTEYIGGGAATDALSSCRVLDFLFEHLPKNYEVKFENIL